MRLTGIVDRSRIDGNAYYNMIERRTFAGGGQLNTVEVKDLARILKVHRSDDGWETGPKSGATFLVGAGCSRSAGIKLAGEIARDLVVQLARKLGAPESAVATPESAQEWLVAREHLAFEGDWGRTYSRIFDKLLISKRQQRETIQRVIADGGNRINWAHVCLGELVKRCYVHTVLTTNFDQLVARGIILTGLLPVIADGVEAMNRLEAIPHYPQIVHLHGSMHTYNPRNGAGETQGTSELLPMQGTLWNVCLNADLLVVIGYAGTEEGIVDVLRSASVSLPNLVIYWIMYGSDLDELAPKVRDLLEGPNKFLIIGQDADAFFAELMNHLGEPIGWMEEPLRALLDIEVALSDRAKWNSEVTRENIRTSLDFHHQKLRAMEETQLVPVDQSNIARARAANLSGNDELVIAILANIPQETEGVAPLLAQSLIRSGDAARDEDKLKKSIEVIQHRLIAAPDDYSMEIMRGDAESALADLLDQDADRHAAAAHHRELAVAAYRDAMGHVPVESLTTWRSVREKFATAVSESGNQGGAPELLTLAIDALDELLNHPADFEMSRLELAEILDRVAMLRLMRGTLSHNREDLLEARSKSADARDMVIEDLSTTTAIGILRDHASANRALGRHSISEGRVHEGRSELQRAAELYAEAGEAYLDGVTDAEEAQSRAAAADAFEEARLVYIEMGAHQLAAELEEVIGSTRS